MSAQTRPFRKTSQDLMSAEARPHPQLPALYDLYPAAELPGRIGRGFTALAEALRGQRAVRLDGFAGVMWAEFRERLQQALSERGVRVEWVDVSTALKPQEALEALLRPHTGGDDPVFGKCFEGDLADFYDLERLRQLRPDPDPSALTIAYGPGAALLGWEGLLVYLDLPKNELQFRARAGLLTNLGLSEALPPKAAYKRSYFVDWPALGRHKAGLLERLDLIVDAQRPDDPTFTPGQALREGLARLSRTAFRVRPWFEPGPWGGQWIKRHLPELPQGVPNYAWSFELITPENGLVFESGGLRLEVSFDLLMFGHPRAVLGEAAERFGSEFPIRFDWLDTVEGGNLSVQCHPRPEYIRRHFGERFTQDETYYILDGKAGASVYLGFREGIDPAHFRRDLEASFAHNTPVDIPRYVQQHPAERHDLFLIPSGTIHCSGEGCLVLEISATPYIFTFKMYDWLRLDLDGKPRPLNIERAFDNLDFSRQGTRVEQELISRPYVLGQGDGWRLIHQPTHPEHFYDVHRLEFSTSVEVNTDDQCHVLALVEGSSVLLETPDGAQHPINYAETWVVPAAAERYRLVNQGPTPAKVVKAFVKPGRGP